ncbi:MAG: hypothetical protein LBQ66_05145 [Planctomycetaceae bacterium]|nr:hypothetical protein [Planctomycetaceae bacterium]
MPTRFGAPFQLVRFYYAQRRAGHPRSSPRRFAASLYDITRQVRRCYSQRKPNGQLSTLRSPTLFYQRNICERSPYFTLLL